MTLSVHAFVLLKADIREQFGLPEKISIKNERKSSALALVLILREQCGNWKKRVDNTQ